MMNNHRVLIILPTKLIQRFHGRWLRAGAAVLMILLPAAGTRAGDGSGSAGPRWQVNLQSGSGLRPLIAELTHPWSKQQNVVFLGPDRVAVFQVNELRRVADLSARDASGGGGNFFLDIRVFDAREGRLIRALHLRTNAEISDVLPTHDGRWIARTGDIMYVLSPGFEKLAERNLRLQHTAPVERWEMAVSPSGREVIMVHQQLFSLPEPFLGKEGKARAQLEILDADTLETTRTFSLPHFLSDWSAADEFLVAPNPNSPLRESEFGRLDFDGNWSSFKLGKDGCQSQVDALRQHALAAYGCGRLAVMSLKSEVLFSRKISSGEIVASVDGNGEFVAVELARPAMRELPGTRIPIPFAKPLRIEAFDIAKGALALSIPVRGDDVYFDVSPQGLLAVVDGAILKLYELQS